MAKIQKSPEGTVKVRVLLDCAHGKCNEVVEMDAAMAAASTDQVDANPEAVAYAESLKP